MDQNFLKNLKKRLFTAVPLLALGTLIYFYAPWWTPTVLTIAITLWILIVEWPRLVSPKTLFFWIVTPFYPTLPLFILILFAQNTLSIPLIILILVHDSAAYFAGNIWGKHKLAPKISPNKTWEGFIGGIVGIYCALMAYRLSGGYFSFKGAYWLLVLAFIISIVATLGDLLESWFKRRAGVKDSGSLLPGHGGLLDKVDSIIIAVPFCIILMLIAFGNLAFIEYSDALQVQPLFPFFSTHKA